MSAPIGKSARPLERGVKIALALGWLSLLCSAVFLYLSTDYLSLENEGDEGKLFLYITFARMAGIGAFVAGVVGIMNQCWNSGTILLVGSLALPFISLLFHGTI